MADLDVPQAAVLAVLTHGWGDVGSRDSEAITRSVLAVAAPHIAAAALRQAAEDMWDRSDGLAQVYSAWLRHRANQVDGRQPSQDTREGIIAAAGLTEADMQERADG